MLYETFDDDDRIRKMIRGRLWEIYRNDARTYNPEEDDDADNKMNTVTSLLQTANSDLYNIVFTINEREPVETKVNVEPPEPPSGPVPMEPLIAPTEPTVLEQEPEEEAQYEEEPGEAYDEDVYGFTDKQLKDIPKTINGIMRTMSNREKAINGLINNIVTKQNNITKKNEEIDDLNVKQMGKYTDPRAKSIDQANRMIEKYENEIKALEIKIDDIKANLEMDRAKIEYLDAKLQQGTAEYEGTEATEEVTGSGPKPGKKVVRKVVVKEVAKKVPNYRSVNLYVNFAQYVLNLTKNLYKVNQIFKDGLIYHYDYVEPSTMKEYYKAYDELQKMFTNFMKLTHIDNVFKITLKGTAYNPVEKAQLTEKVKAMIDELDRLHEYNIKVRHNYNYKHVTMASKRSPLSSNTVNPSLYDEDD
jgi:hypothetical protein